MTHDFPSMPEMDETREAAVAWFSRWRSGQMAEAELDAMEAWLRLSPEHPRAFEDVADLWDEVEASRGDPAVMAMREKALRSAGRVRTWTMLARAAAVLVVAVGAVSLTRWTLDRSQPTEYTTNVGEQSTIHLRDGSKVTLDTDSQLKVWPVGAKRRLELVRGRAFFEVAKDARHPFVVSTDQGSVTALGTAFDVRDDAAGMKIVLVEGKVRIRPAALLSKTVDMTAGNEFMSDRNGWRLAQADAQTETSWTRGSLVFREAPLSQIVGELNRYSTDKITITDPGIGQHRLSAVLKSGDIDAFLNSVELLKIASVQRKAEHEILLAPAG